MKSRYADQVKAELNRLIDQGWSDFPINDFGLQVSVQVNEEDISFPSDTYNLHEGNQESTGIWAKWRAREIHKLVKKNNLSLIWEVGSGHGNVAIPLVQKGIAVIAIEPLLNGAFITSNSGVRTYLGTLQSMKFPPESISAIGLFDVLEHLENPKVLLAEIYRVLKPGGILLVSVPSHQWLFSDFDSAIGHFRRYSKRDLELSLEIAGFQAVSSKYLFSAFVLPALLLRKIPTIFGRRRNSKQVISSAERHFKFLKLIEVFVVLVLYFERILHLPFGLSIISTGKKS